MKTIFWDFDGVILDSMSVREFGFREIFKDFDQKRVDALLDYHRRNGGLSRYVKIRYFYEKILSRPVSETQLSAHARQFAEIMMASLTRKDLLINDSLSFIIENYNRYNFHMVSGSDQDELRFLCRELEIDSYFLSINGSPKPKVDWIAEIMKDNGYTKNSSCLIGDSSNDFDAAIENGIRFFGYNNESLRGRGTYIEELCKYQWL